MQAVQIHSVKSLLSWDACARLFTQSKAPRNTVHWSANERPLRDTSAPHLKVIEEEYGSFALKLYDTVLVRYHRPAGGERAVDLYLPTRWTTRSTWEFLANAGWHHNKGLEALRHKTPVFLGLYPSAEPRGHTAHMVFTSEFKLRTQESWHLQAYRLMSDGAVPVYKAKVAAALRDIATLLEMSQKGITPAYDKRYRPPYQYPDLAPGRQRHDTTLPQLAEIVDGTRKVLDEPAFDGLMRWFVRMHDVHYTLHNEKAQWSIEEILARIASALVQHVGREEFTNTGKRPRKMWTKTKHPRSIQYFMTRAEAEQAAIDCGV